MKRILLSLLFFLTTSSFSQDPFWQHLDSTYDESVSAMTITRSGYVFASFGPGQIHRSTDHGLTWAMVWDSTLNTIVYSMIVDSSGDVFAATSTRTPGPFGTYVGRLIRSTDNGMLWCSSDTGMVGVTVTVLGISRFNVFFAGSYNGTIYRSTNNGRSWALVRSGSIGDNISSLTFDSNDYIYAASFSGDGGGQVYRSTDNGIGWTSLGAFGRSIYSLAVGDGDTMFAGTYDAPSNDGGIFRSTNHGTAWSQVGLQNTSVSALLIAGPSIFAATYGSGIYRSTNSGLSWNSANSGLTNLDVRTLSIAPNGFLFAGTRGGGVHRSSQPVVGIEEIGNRRPEIFSLQQNYPNPFNPSTTIRYELPHSAFVTLTVYNILGQQVDQLVSEQQYAGHKQVTFQNGTLASGVYTYRLRAGNYVAERKMLLLR